ncbi:MAG: tetratricopeptide repeat protein, partial [Chloroflexi bacterium]|nr:tetratricopeptide repeat protein [Chloroflexota bacterium]
MLAQLGNRLRLLSSGARDAVARQQTLRATIDWSYQLLSADEKQLFAQLAVFVGGCTLEAAEAVCDTDASLNVLDGLQSLMDKSLLRQVEVNGEPRFSMLETIREFAHERLAQSSEWRDVQERHFNFYVTLVEQVKLELRGRLQREYLERLELDHDNFRAALDWAWQLHLDEQLLRLGAALDLFWRQRDDWSEACKWFGLMLTLDTQPEHDDLRRHILVSSAYVAFFSGEFETARQQARTCLEVSQAVGDQQRQAEAYLVLGTTAMAQSAFAEAHTLLQQAQTLFRAAGDQLGVGDALHWLGHTAQEQGDYAQARAYFQDSYTRMNTLGDLTTQTLLLGDLGTAFYLQEDFATARGYCEQDLALCRALGRKFGMAIALNLLGDIARCEEDDARADTLYHDSLSLYQ